MTDKAKIAITISSIIGFFICISVVMPLIETHITFENERKEPSRRATMDNYFKELSKSETLYFYHSNHKDDPYHNYLDDNDYTEDALSFFNLLSQEEYTLYSEEKFYVDYKEFFYFENFIGNSSYEGLSCYFLYNYPKVYIKCETSKFVAPCSRIYTFSEEVHSKMLKLVNEVEWIKRSYN